MSTITLSRSARSGDLRAGLPFALAALAVAGLSAFLAGWAPLGFSIVTVFLFAGPHNWMEGRYFLSRMPARWGSLRAFFLTGIAGALALPALFFLLPRWSAAASWSDADWHTAVACWNTLLIAWVWALVQLRARQNPRR